MMNKIKLTMLNSMASYDFDESLKIHRNWGIDNLDLKDGVYGKNIIDLTDEEAEKAKFSIAENELNVYCFSTTLFYEEIEIGETEFRKRSVDHLNRILDLADILKPNYIRLLAAKSTKRSEHSNNMDYIRSSYPWLVPLYREAIDKIHARGFATTIENEAHACIFSTPYEVTEFFKDLNVSDKVSFTYDIQNLWQMGTFPTVESFNQLKEITSYFHLKGGRGNDKNELAWSTSLEDASWPVLEITKLAIQSGISPVICLNPSHGQHLENYDYTNVVKRDIDFLRKQFTEVE